jgi:hypothetical protein
VAQPLRNIFAPRRKDAKKTFRSAAAPGVFAPLRDKTSLVFETQRRYTKPQKPGGLL